MSLLSKFVVSETEMAQRQVVKYPGRIGGWRVVLTLPTLQRMHTALGGLMVPLLVYLCLLRESRLPFSSCRRVSKDGTAWYVVGRSLLAGFTMPESHVLNRAVRSLEAAGVVHVQRGQGRRPRIRLLA